MKFDIITVFPNAFSFLNESIPKRAQDKELVEINIHDLRNYSSDKWKTIDDRPFGGGAGMVLKVEPIYKALKAINAYPKGSESSQKILLMSARGLTWTQSLVEDYSNEFDRIILICGHYEGVDQRVIDNFVDEEICVGSYILSGGELAAMIVVDTMTRLVEGVVGNEESIKHETSFNKDFKTIEYPHYTRPEIFKTDEGESLEVPKVLLSGNHKEIEKWKEGSKQDVKL
jgi:tRNA (guanine37-N1)-methyltransferase